MFRQFANIHPTAVSRFTTTLSKKTLLSSGKGRSYASCACNTVSILHCLMDMTAETIKLVSPLSCPPFTTPIPLRSSYVLHYRKDLTNFWHDLIMGRLTSTNPCMMRRTMKIPDPVLAAEGRRKFSSPDVAIAVPKTLEMGEQLRLKCAGTKQGSLSGTRKAARVLVKSSYFSIVSLAARGSGASPFLYSARLPKLTQSQTWHGPLAKNILAKNNSSLMGRSDMTSE